MSMSQDASVLFANEAFYLALAGGDLTAMRDVWADSGPVCCIHPGWEALTDWEDVFGSWIAVLKSPPAVRCVAPEVQIYGDVAAVFCFEEIAGNYLLATNIYRRLGGRWRMVHHHAGPTNAVPDEEHLEDPRSVN